MSTLVENVAKVTAAHAALKTAIASKGVDVPDGAKLTDMPALVEQIQAEPVPTYSRSVFAGDSATSITVPETLVVDMRSLTDLRYAFYFCRHTTSIKLPDGFGQNATSLNSCFDHCDALKSLTLPDGFGKSATETRSCFLNCTNLTTITGNPNFKANTSFSSCTKLTHDSLMVVINGLQTVTSSKNLTIGEKNLAKLTDEEKKIATDKGWTLT